MNAIEQLHTAVRRYCMEQYMQWSLAYSELLAAGKDREGNRYTDEALATFPRYNVLNAVLTEIERYRPQDFSNFNEARDFFKLVAGSAQSIFTERPIGPIDTSAMNDERLRLVEFIDCQSPQTVQTVEPLFYRRVLSKPEEDSIRNQVKDRWGISHWYWYPLSEAKPPDVEAFQDKYFENEVGRERIISILASGNVNYVFEIGEGDASYEIELSVLEPCYNGLEAFWFDSSLSWTLYASHESSITIGGWLLDEVKAIWPNWKNRIWTSPFFE
jgi:hypothetical protein